MRPNEGEILVDLVGKEPQVMLAAKLGNAGDLFWRKDGSGRIMRTVDPRFWRLSI